MKVIVDGCSAYVIVCRINIVCTSASVNEGMPDSGCDIVAMCVLCVLSE